MNIQKQGGLLMNNQNQEADGGQGDSKVVQWCRKEAEKGDIASQFTLGLMYRYGLGTLQDFVKSHFWLNVAAAWGNSDAQEARSYLEKRMTPEQLDQAQVMARKWLEQHPASCRV
jgi:TPR repeat protein